MDEFHNHSLLGLHKVSDNTLSNQNDATPTDLDIKLFELEKRITRLENIANGFGSYGVHEEYD